MAEIPQPTMASTREEAAMSDFANAHMRRHHNEYTYRLPTPPRIVVPPPTLTTEMPNLVVEHDSAAEVDLSFLKEMNLEDIVQKNILLEWSYERRRQAQMILPWLYLGPMLAAKDKAFLAREGITMVLAIRAQQNSMMGALNAAREVCPEVATIESPTFHDLTGHLPETTRMINTHVARVRQHSLQTTGQPALGKVLVFCESGNEKAAAVAAAYMMETLVDFDHIQSMQVCQAQRFCVNFDDTIKNILRSYWDILQARRSVATSSSTEQTPCNHANGHIQNGTRPHPHAVNAPKQKRRIDHTMDEDDMDMDETSDPSDALRFANRDITPFQSRDY